LEKGLAKFQLTRKDAGLQADLSTKNWSEGKRLVISTWNQCSTVRFIIERLELGDGDASGICDIIAGVVRRSNDRDFAIWRKGVSTPLSRHADEWQIPAAIAIGAMNDRANTKMDNISH
jgi:hypothetical protein